MIPRWLDPDKYDQEGIATNKWNRLLAALDAVFGMKGKEKSKFMKLSQDFDERTNEHVIVLEYRVKVAGTMKSAPREGIRAAADGFPAPVGGCSGQNSVTGFPASPLPDIW